MSDKVISSTTQEFLDVYDIINDVVLLKDGTASIILQIGTMNFSLLAEQEQDAVIFTYGSLLNSLNYPIQINIQSQTKDATKYLRLLDEQVQKASSDRKAALIKQYRDFVATLIRERNVLQKRFYISVPASPGEMGMITPSGVLPGKTGFDASTVEKSTMLEKAMNVLEPRKDHLIAQFNRLGLFARQLSTQEIIQNFYINYNPEAAEGQEISSSENYATPLVRARFGKKFMPNDQSSPTNPINPQGQVLQDLTAQSQILQSQITTSPQASPEAAFSELSSSGVNTQTAVEPIIEPTMQQTVGSTTEPNLEQTLSPIIESNPFSQEAIVEPVLDFTTQPTTNLATQISPTTNQIQPTLNIEASAPIDPILEQTSAMEQTPIFEQSAAPSIMSQQPIVPESPVIQEVDLQLDANLLNNGQNTPISEQMPNMDIEPTTELAPVMTEQTVTQEQTIAPAEIFADFTEEIAPLQRQNNFTAPPVTQVNSTDQNQNQLLEQQV